jgi:hypothetical protein
MPLSAFPAPALRAHPLSRIGKISGGIAIGTAVLLAASPALAASGWNTVPIPPTGVNANLTGVTSTSDSDAWAVGSELGRAGTTVGAKVLIDHWNGTAWSQVTTPATPQNTATLASVSASSPADAWAVGRDSNARSNFQPLGLHWNGTAWSVSPSLASALGGQLGVGVTDISPTDAYAIGGHLGSAHNGLVARWDGTAWSQVTVPLPQNNNMLSDLDAISASGPDNVWIVGTFQEEITPTDFPDETYSLHWNGTAWSIVPMPLEPGTNPNEFFHFNAIEANSPTDVWAVGDQGVIDGATSTLIEHFNGTAWSIVPSPSAGNGATLTGVTTASAANSVWAVGGDEIPGTTTFQTLTEHWDGTAWSVVPSPNAGSTTTFLSGVATTPGASIVQAVGTSGITGSFNPFAIQNG